MELKLAFIGFGNVARAFARILTDRKSPFNRDFDLSWKTTAIATARHGCITSADEIELMRAVNCVESGDNLSEVGGSIPANDPTSVVQNCDADVLFETTPLNISDGGPAVTYIRTALSRGINVITANKGPVAFAYSELKELAEQHGANFRFEGVVMDGAPVFNLVEKCLPGTRVVGFAGVLNSTTNLVLTEMEKGRSFEDALVEAQRRGIAEANADHDIDGWDAAVKAVALANVLMDCDARPADVDRKGIREVTADSLVAAKASGRSVRLVSRGRREGTDVRLTVALEIVPLASTLGGVRGTSNALIIETDLMGELAIVETDPGVDQTAYALLSDLIVVHETLNRRQKH